jgi:hypothetical protein
MRDDGSLSWVGNAAGVVTDCEMLLTNRAFSPLMTRTGIGGADYLKRCWPKLRARNFNEWTNLARKTGLVVDSRVSNEEFGPTDLKLRTRNAPIDNMLNPSSMKREIFAVVGPAYQDYDVDIIAKALLKSVPDGARGTLTYDGYKARFEVMFHTDIQPEKFVAGEFFKAGVIISTDDTGGGSLSGSAAVWQNLCLNLLIIDTMEDQLFRIKHIGDVNRIASQFKEGFSRAMKKISYFIKAWGYASEDDLRNSGRVVADDSDTFIPTNSSVLMQGIFNGVLEKELVLVRAKPKIAVPKLMEMWSKDTSAAAGTTRAAVVNAFTRYAHEADQATPWQEDEIQKSVGNLLYGKRKRDGSRVLAPLPYSEFKGG